ncbi:MAG: hypothetical protein H8E66_20665 [Planctomycetes bacterium]|nr:hypothetical protein [Planctomycetota bacterium]
MRVPVPGYQDTVTVSRQYFDDPAYQSRQQAAFQAAQRRGQAAAARIELQNQATQRQNEQIAEVLRNATQSEREANPRAWWNWWQEYTDEHPELRVQALQSGRADSLLHLPSSSVAIKTPVWTNTGRRPIEQIQVGDLVLARHLETGELAYKPVLQVKRSVAPARRLTVKDTEFLCASGLTLLRRDKGWWLARDLETDSLVHGMFGPAPVTDNVEMIEGPMHHLVVADFNNFFISDQAVLVHDATPPQSTTLQFRGLAPQASNNQE